VIGGSTVTLDGNTVVGGANASVLIDGVDRATVVNSLLVNALHGIDTKGSVNDASIDFNTIISSTTAFRVVQTSNRFCASYNIVQAGTNTIRVDSNIAGLPCWTGNKLIGTAATCLDPGNNECTSITPPWAASFAPSFNPTFYQTTSPTTGPTGSDRFGYYCLKNFSEDPSIPTSAVTDRVYPYAGMPPTYAGSFPEPGGREMDTNICFH
jgi:hypothetical protein